MASTTEKHSTPFYKRTQTPFFYKRTHTPFFYKRIQTPFFYKRTGFLFPTFWTTCWTVAAVLTICLPSSLLAGQTKTDWNNLLTALKTNYNTDIRPFNDSYLATDVYLGVQLLSILDVSTLAKTSL
jgi:hypothetical protein